MQLLTPAPGVTNGAGTLVEFKDKNGGAIASLVLGKRYIQAEVNVDDETLGAIASVTGGKFFKVVDANQLRDAFDTIGIVLAGAYKESATKGL